MKEVKDLQTLINERAEKRLDKDIEGACELIQNNTILRRTNDIPQISLIEDAESKQYPYWFFRVSGKYMKAVKEVLLPSYIQEETKMFMQKVDNLQGQIDELLNQRQEEQDLPY